MKTIIAFLLSLLAIQVNFPQPAAIHVPSPSPIPTIASSPTPTPFQVPSRLTDISVPFIVQAPFGQWKDARYQDACEEATVLMAISWAQGLPLDKDIANTKIAQISAWETEKYHEFRDFSARDTYERIVLGYFQYQNAEYIPDISLKRLVQYLYEGKLVIAPMNGQALHNPYFTQPGPERHMVLIRGYDPAKKEFITNDPGVGPGEKYRYPEDVFYAAIRDYPTGYHVPITKVEKNIIVISNS